MLVVGFFCSTAFSALSYFGFLNSCFNTWQTGVRSYNSPTRSGNSYSFTPSITFANTMPPFQNCEIAVADINLGTSAASNYDWSVSTASCLSTGMTFTGSVSVTSTSQSTSRLPSLAGQHPLTPGVNWLPVPATATTATITVTYASGSVTLANTPLLAHFIRGYNSLILGGQQLGVKCSNPVVGTGSYTFTVDTSAQSSNCKLNRLDVTYVVLPTKPLMLGTALDWMKIARDSFYDNQQIQNTGSNKQQTFNSIAPSSLQSNAFYGLHSLISKTTPYSTASIAITFNSITGSNDYRYVVTSNLANTFIAGFGYSLIIFYGYNCMPTNFVNTARNDCVAACAVGEYSDACNVCWPCYYACSSCSGTTSTSCTACLASSNRVPSPSATPPYSCVCSPGYLQHTPSQMNCDACDSSCTTCLVASASSQCSGCRPNRTPTPSATAPFSCPCSPGYLSVASVCTACATNCSSCTGTITHCTACNATFWLAVGFTCASTCPAGQYKSATVGICSSCVSAGPNYCATCTSASACLSCSSSRYLLGTSCLSSCPNGYFPTPGQCNSCPSVCTLCTGLSSCTACTSTNSLYFGQCVVNCPSGYLSDPNPLGGWMCINCAFNCINLTSFTIDYQSERPTSGIWVNLTFTKPLNYPQLMLQMPGFKFTQTIVSPEPNQYCFKIDPDCAVLGQLTLLASTPALKLSAVRGLDYSPLNSDVWNVTRSFNFIYFCGAGTGLTQVLSGPSNSFYNLTRLVPPQVLQAFSFYAPSFQLTSSILFANFPLPKHLYDGLRLISLSNLYDIPPWQGQTKGGRTFFGYKPVQQLNNSRMLLDSLVPYRLYRTNLNSYFLFNCYVQILMLVVCFIIWASILMLAKMHLAGPKLVGTAWSLLDHGHQYLTMYLVIATVIQIEAYSAQGWVSYFSLALCVFCNVQFVFYQLYRFYDMAKFSEYQPVDPQYNKELPKFAHLLKNTRIQSITLPHYIGPFFSPRYFHLVSSIKKTVMMVAFSLFADQIWYQIGFAALAQLLQSARFVAVRPYNRLWRNLARGAVELLMAGQFLMLVGMGYLISHMSEFPEYLQYYNWLGWLSLSICYLFNLYFLTQLVLTLVEKCRGESALCLQQVQSHYLQLLYTEKDSLSPALLRELVTKGNLNNADVDSLPEIDVRIERVQLSRQDRGYRLEVSRCLELRMNTQGSYFNHVNNTLQTQKLHRQLFISSLESEVGSILGKYLEGGRYLEVKCFARIKQSEYKYGQSIPLRACFQQVRRNQEDPPTKLQSDQMLPQFPLSPARLRLICTNN